MNVQNIGSPNFTSGRGGNPIQGFIVLPNGQKVVYDSEDEAIVNLYKWQYCSGYARYQKEKRVNGKRTFERIYLHRLITNAKPNQIIDHKNGNMLDNRRVNLRLADKSSNAANSKVRTDNTSGYRGVTKLGKKWIAQANYRGEHYYLGLYNDIKKAAKVARKFRINKFKEFAK